MDIIGQIQSAAWDFEATTGKRANYVYLGRREHKQLMKLAADHQYIMSPTASSEGAERPEVAGVLVFRVNDESHMAFSAPAGNSAGESDE